jgi:hypothetical protein
MKKFNIQTNTITLNKELISIFSLELKSIKYILYSGLSIDESLIPTNDFEKMEFTDDIQILPKKKFNDAKLTITKTNGISKILYLGNPVYSLKDSKNIIVNNPHIKLITSFGKLYDYLSNINTKSIHESNLVTDILNKNKIVDNIQNLPLIHDLSQESINCEIKDHNITEYIGISDEENTNESDNTEENIVVNDEDDNSINKSIIIEEDNNANESDIIETIEDNNANESDIIEINKDVVENIVVEEDNKANEYDIIENNIFIKKEPIEIDQIIIKNDDTILKSTTELFSLENILSDFNKLFDISDLTKITNENILNHNKEIETKQNIDAQEQIQVKPIKKDEIKNIYNIYTLRINYNNNFYKISTIKLKETPDLNFSNLYKTKIFECNIINNINISFELETFNSSYLISVFNQKYLIIKNDNIVIITNLQSRQSNVTKNNDNFKLVNYDYILYNGTLLLSMINKKIFDNNYGTSYNVYIPRSL